MRASLLSRSALAAAGAAVALVATGSETLAAFGVATVAFWLVGEGRTWRRIGLTLAPFILTSAALWIFVNSDGPLDAIAQAKAVLAPQAPFLRLLRAMAGSMAVALAFGVIPDGEAYSLFRRAKAPPALALLLSSALVSATTISESVLRSHTALRAQGIVGPRALDRFVGLGPLISLAWIASLETAVARAECAWTGNGLLADLAENHRPRSTDETFSSAVLALAAAALVVSLVGGTLAHHLI